MNTVGLVALQKVNKKYIKKGCWVYEACFSFSEGIIFSQLKMSLMQCMHSVISIISNVSMKRTV